jgi:hypothetical protein
MWPKEEALGLFKEQALDINLRRSFEMVLRRSLRIEGLWNDYVVFPRSTNDCAISALPPEHEAILQTLFELTASIDRPAQPLLRG